VTGAGTANSDGGAGAGVFEAEIILESSEVPFPPRYGTEGVDRVLSRSSRESQEILEIPARVQPCIELLRVIPNPSCSSAVISTDIILEIPGSLLGAGDVLPLNKLNPNCSRSIEALRD